MIVPNMDEDTIDGLAVINVDQLSRDVNAIVQASAIIDPPFEECPEESTSEFCPRSGSSTRHNGLSQVYFRTPSYCPTSSGEPTQNLSGGVGASSGTHDGNGKLVPQLNRGVICPEPKKYASISSTYSHHGATSISRLRPILPAIRATSGRQQGSGSTVRRPDANHMASVTPQMETEYNVSQSQPEYNSVDCSHEEASQSANSSQLDVGNFSAGTPVVIGTIGDDATPNELQCGTMTNEPSNVVGSLNPPVPLDIQVPSHSGLHLLNSLNNHSAQNLLTQMALLSPTNQDVGGTTQSQSSTLLSLLSPHSQSSLLPLILRTMASMGQSGSTPIESSLLTESATSDLSLPQAANELAFPEQNISTVRLTASNHETHQLPQHYKPVERQTTNDSSIAAHGAPGDSTLEPKQEMSSSLAPSIITSSIHSLSLPATGVTTSALNGEGTAASKSSSYVNIVSPAIAQSGSLQLTGVLTSRGQAINAPSNGNIDLQGVALQISAIRNNYPSASRYQTILPKEVMPDPGDEFWCVHCDETMPQFCPQHGPPTIIPDTPIQRRARMTLPPSLFLKKSNVSKEFIGVWAKQTYKPGCQFGPMEGIYLKKLVSDVDALSPYIWKIFQQNKVKYYLDVKNEDVSNWMMFVKKARKLEEQNLSAHQVKGRIYYTTKREIKPGEELLLWYNKEYAKMCGATLLPEDSFKCTLCGRQFSYRQELEGHMQYRHPSTSNRKHTCKECGKVFSTTSKLKVHSTKHTGDKPYSCKICHKPFTDSSNLRRHARIHSGEKKYQCSVCGMSFRQKAHLVTHSVIHTGEKKFKCHFCLKLFARKSDIRQHLMLHSQEKKYKCTYCPSAFVRKQHLKNHMLTHTKERNFACNLCKKGFLMAAHLQRHKVGCSKKYLLLARANQV